MQADFLEKNSSYFECLAKTYEEVEKICEKYESNHKSLKEIEKSNEKFNKIISKNIFNNKFYFLMIKKLKKRN